MLQSSSILLPGFALTLPYKIVEQFSRYSGQMIACPIAFLVAAVAPIEKNSEFR